MKKKQDIFLIEKSIKREDCSFQKRVLEETWKKALKGLSDSTDPVTTLTIPGKLIKAGKEVFDIKTRIERLEDDGAPRWQATIASTTGTVIATGVGFVLEKLLADVTIASVIASGFNNRAFSIWYARQLFIAHVTDVIADDLSEIINGWIATGKFDFTPFETSIKEEIKSITNLLPSSKDCKEEDHTVPTNEPTSQPTTPGVKVITFDGHPGNQTAIAWRDPNLVTFDKLQYDFQAPGDYTLVKGKGVNDTFEIRVRNKLLNERVSVIDSVAIDLDGTKLMLTSPSPLRSPSPSGQAIH